MPVFRAPVPPSRALPSLPLEILHHIIEDAVANAEYDHEESISYELVNVQWLNHARRVLRSRIVNPRDLLTTFGNLRTSPSRAGQVTTIHINYIQFHILDQLLSLVPGLIQITVGVQVEDPSSIIPDWDAPFDYNNAQMEHWRITSPFLGKNLPRIENIEIRQEPGRRQMLVPTLRPLAIALAPFSTLKHLKAVRMFAWEVNDVLPVQESDVPASTYALETFTIDATDAAPACLDSISSVSAGALKSLTLKQVDHTPISVCLRNYRFLKAASSTLRNLYLTLPHFLHQWSQETVPETPNIIFPHLKHLTLSIRRGLDDNDEFGDLRNLFIAPSLETLYLDSQGQYSWGDNPDEDGMRDRAFCVAFLARLIKSQHFPSLRHIKIMNRTGWEPSDREENDNMMRDHDTIIYTCEVSNIKLEWVRCDNYLQLIEKLQRQEDHDNGIYTEPESEVEDDWRDQWEDEMY